MDKTKRYIVRKYVMATSVIDAIRREKKQAVDDVWIDDDWKKEQQSPPPRRNRLQSKAA